MSKNVEFDIQKFSGGGADWTAGITGTAIDDAVMRFQAQIGVTIEVISDRTAVADALTNGWSGQAREDFLAKLDAHCANIIAEIREYSEAVKKEAEAIKVQWSDFDSSLIS